jgi:hypothetical protein
MQEQVRSIHVCLHARDVKGTRRAGVLSGCPSGWGAPGCSQEGRLGFSVPKAFSGNLQAFTALPPKLIKKDHFEELGQAAMRVIQSVRATYPDERDHKLCTAENQSIAFHVLLLIRPPNI